jgi:hypothetical protein
VVWGCGMGEALCRGERTAQRADPPPGRAGLASDLLESIKFLLEKELISARLATSLINWKHSGFSLNCSVRIGSHSDKARKALSQYISRRMAVPPPLPLKKLSIQENGEATLISYTSDNEFFQGKTKPFSVTRFLLEVTQHEGCAPRCPS